METNLYRFAVIGQDMRQVYLAEILAECGYDVSVYGLEKKTENPKIKETLSLREVLEDADIIAAPVPFFQTGNILEYAKPESMFFAGGIPEAFTKQAEIKNVKCVDYMKDDFVGMQNTVATAEGIIAEAIKRSPRNLQKSSCLVLGYGRCGSTLVSCLKKFSCKVTVYEKEKSVLARADILADKVTDDLEVSGCLEEAQYIFNTIPALVLPKAMLEYVKKDVLILDLASSPGGVDYEAAKNMGIEAVLLPGLPGKYAPLSSAEILAEAIIREIKTNVKR